VPIAIPTVWGMPAIQPGASQVAKQFDAPLSKEGKDRGGHRGQGRLKAEEQVFSPACFKCPVMHGCSLGLRESGDPAKFRVGELWRTRRLKAALRANADRLAAGCIAESYGRLSQSKASNLTCGKKSAARKPRQMWTNYRCSDQGLAGFACHTSTAPDSTGKQNHPERNRNNKLSFPSSAPSAPRPRLALRPPSCSCLFLRPGAFPAR
jgi:hypothetical protein